MNVPNMLTSLRVVLAIVLFAILPLEWYAVGIVLFVLAAVTDFLDGWWARKFNQVSIFGRIMDPFADKLLICGSFVYLVTIPALTTPPAGIPGWLMLGPWMAVVIIGRELLITSLRAVVERQGGDFSAKWIGKWKMALQCVVVPATLLWLIVPQPVLFWVMIASLWGTIAITVYSGIDYIFKAAKALR